MNKSAIDNLIRSMDQLTDYSNVSYDESLAHFGIKGRSGRYKLGSGKSNKKSSGPILSEKEFQDYKNKKDNSGLIVRDKNTSKDNTSKDNTSKDNTSKDNTSKDNTSKDNTSKDNTSKDNTSKDNTSKDNTSKDNTTDSLKVIGASGKIAKGTVELGQTVVKNYFTSKNVKQTSKMSDEELRNTTNRMELENRYMNAKSVQDGRRKVNDVLSILGSAVGVATSAVTVYDIIKRSRRT